MIVRSHRVVLPDGVRPASIHISDGRIVRVDAHDDQRAHDDRRAKASGRSGKADDWSAKALAERDAALIDFGDLVVSPGIVDTHVHVNEPGRISLNRFVELTTTSPAKLFGLFPRKGTIAPGSDADIVVFDPNRTITLAARTLHMNCDYNPYEGREVTGVTDTVISRGRVIIDGGKFVGRAGAGSFLKRSARS